MKIRNSPKKVWFKCTSILGIVKSFHRDLSSEPTRGKLLHLTTKNTFLAKKIKSHKMSKDE